MKNHSKIRIGVVGTGFVSKGFVRILSARHDLEVSRVLTRRSTQGCSEYPIPGRLTNSVDDLIDNSDLIVECSGNVIHATSVIDRVLKAKLPVVTMNSEFHVTTGSYFVDKGTITEAEGDQPGCLAALHEELVAMGFNPLVYGNVKGFLNKYPSSKEMEYWATRQGISIDQVISFTDGTKVNIEQAFVANGLGASIIKQGLVGPVADSLVDGALFLAEYARKINKVVSDYVLCANSSGKVFIVAEHNQSQREDLRYFKLGDGPNYVLIKDFHLVYFEIIKTIKRVIFGNGELLNNSKKPTISVAAITKRDLKAGDKLAKGIGSYDVRGEAVIIVDFPDHVPIGLLYDVIMAKDVKKDTMILSNDVIFPESLAVNAWEAVKSKVLSNG